MISEKEKGDDTESSKNEISKIKKRERWLNHGCDKNKKEKSTRQRYLGLKRRVQAMDWGRAVGGCKEFALFF